MTVFVPSTAQIAPSEIDTPTMEAPGLQVQMKMVK